MPNYGNKMGNLLFDIRMGLDNSPMGKDRRPEYENPTLFENIPFTGKTSIGYEFRNKTRVNSTCNVGVFTGIKAADKGAGVAFFQEVKGRYEPKSKGKGPYFEGAVDCFQHAPATVYKNDKSMFGFSAEAGYKLDRYGKNTIGAFYENNMNLAPDQQVAGIKYYNKAKKGYGFGSYYKVGVQTSDNGLQPFGAIGFNIPTINISKKTME